MAIDISPGAGFGAILSWKNNHTDFMVVILTVSCFDTPGHQSYNKYSGERALIAIILIEL
jgi:hypothetical protein